MMLPDLERIAAWGGPMKHETLLHFKTAGYSVTGDLHVNTGICRCGDIQDGVSFKHDRNGGWVLSYADLMAIAAAATAQRLDNLNRM